MKSKNILITGATSGFGKLAVQLFLKKGHRVLAGVRGGQARLEQVFGAELARYPKGQLTALDLHLENPQSFGAAAEIIEREFGGNLDVLINNAGSVLWGAFETQTPEQVRRQFEVNFFGPVELTRILIPALRKSQGRILNVTSVAGRVAVPFYGTYAAAKHALEAHTEGLYYDLRPFGVQVGLIEPGSFKTEIVNSGAWGEGSADPCSPYHQSTRAFDQFQTDNYKLAGNPARVARLMSRLVDAKRVPIRSLIGPDAQLLVWSRRFLPENWRVALTHAIFGKLVNKKAVARAALAVDTQ